MKYPVAIAAFGALLIGIAAAFSLNGPVAEAQANTPPTVVSVVTSNTLNGTTDNYPGGSVTPMAGGTKTIYLNGIVEDLDGASMITNVRGVFYRSGVGSGSACAATGIDCFVRPTCGLYAGATAYQKVYSCEIDISYYADSTDASGRYPSENWVAHVEVTDGTDTAQDSSLTKEMSSILSLVVPGNINFGNHSIGDVTTAGNNVEVSISQSGNVNADVEISMPSGLACASGSIPRSNFKWSLSDVGFGSGSANALTGSPVDTNLDVAYGTDVAPAPSKTLYFNVSIPDSIGGSCTGMTTISAISH